ncbi:MAG: hypothetical protein AAFQ77_03720 [Myxococcota bacterium]
MIPPQAKLTGPVRAFLDRSGPLSSMEAGHRSARECGAYAYHQKTYAFSVSADIVRDTLRNSPPARLWSGDAKHQLTYDRNTQTVHLPDDDHPPLTEGMVIVLDLRLVAPVHIPVGFEIVQMDLKSGRMAFGYVRGNRSQGLQRLTIHEDDRQTARIMHETWYDSGSYVRDRFLYPFFHTRLLNAFYDNLRVVAR